MRLCSQPQDSNNDKNSTDPSIVTQPGQAANFIQGRTTPDQK